MNSFLVKVSFFLISVVAVCWSELSYADNEKDEYLEEIVVTAEDLSKLRQSRYLVSVGLSVDYSVGYEPSLDDLFNQPIEDAVEPLTDEEKAKIDKVLAGLEDAFDKANKKDLAKDIGFIRNGLSNLLLAYEAAIAALNGDMSAVAGSAYAAAIARVSSALGGAAVLGKTKLGRAIVAVGIASVLEALISALVDHAVAIAGDATNTSGPGGSGSAEFWNCFYQQSWNQMCEVMP